MADDPKRWLRFRHEGRAGFATLDGDHVLAHDSDMFGERAPAGERLPVASIA